MRWCSLAAGVLTIMIALPGCSGTDPDSNPASAERGASGTESTTAETPTAIDAADTGTAESEAPAAASDEASANGTESSEPSLSGSEVQVVVRMSAKTVTFKVLKPAPGLTPSETAEARMQQFFGTEPGKSLTPGETKELEPGHIEVPFTENR